MNIYLVRHGETDWNKEHKLQGQADIPLNDRGREMAEKTAEGLKGIDFDYAFSSPLERAVETARIIIGDRDVEIKTDPRMKEINFGASEGCGLDDVKDHPENPIYQFEFDTEHYVPSEGGETFDEVYQRSNEFFMEEVLSLEGKYANVLILGHGCTNRTILNSIMEVPLRDFWHAKMHNCNVSIINVSGGVATVTAETLSFCK
ncbi:MAG: histidine phosphatase family protein [Lachnospiraceae bacterium]|nr:histidine phosphatase family protein [Lachnospiraceae bacterium]